MTDTITELTPRLHKVVVIEDQTILRETLKVALTVDGACQVVADFETAEEGLDYARHHDVDLAIVDNVLPGMNGVELIKELKTLNKGIKIIIISSFPKAELIFHAFELGAESFLPKDVPLDELLDAVRRVLQGDTVLSQKIAKNFLRYVTTLRTVPREVEEPDITPQHVKLLQCACQGLSNKEIADRMSLKETHVKTLFNRIYKTLGVSDRASAVYCAIKKGILTVAEG